MRTAKNEPKKVVVMLSTTFPVGHKREKQPTGFRESLLAGKKIHTIREGCTPCAYCGKQVPNDKLVKHRIIFQGLENGKRKIKEQVMNFCSGECAMNEQCSREG